MLLQESDEVKSLVLDNLREMGEYAQVMELEKLYRERRQDDKRLPGSSI